MKRNPNILREFERSPIRDRPLREHVREVYAVVKREGQPVPALRALWRGLRTKLEAERVLRARPPYRAHPNRIIIDVTFYCNLGCHNCNRSCGVEQANAKENMSVEQIERFVRESVEQGRQWEKILVEGGEPTIHPQILQIMDLLVEYRRRHSPKTEIFMATNGYAKGAHEIVAKLPPEVHVNDSGKETVEQVHHCEFNQAPVDFVPEDSSVFANGCLLPCIFGIGLNRYGYYPHPVCGGIDRVFGLDIGRKSLPAPDDAMTEVYSDLCRHCGHFWDSNPVERPEAVERPEPVERPEADARACPGECPGSGAQISPSWRRAYDAYAERKPELTRY